MKLNPLLMCVPLSLVACKDLQPRPQADPGVAPAQPSTPPARPGPAPARQPPGADGTLRVSPGDRCPVTGRPITPGSRWTAAVVLRDGRSYYLLSPRSLVRAYLRPRDAFRVVDERELARLIVLDHETGRPLDARQAHFVLGTALRGPAGPDLVPAASADAAARIQREHPGSRIARLHELTPGQIRNLR
jgi:hypothetical protein